MKGAALCVFAAGISFAQTKLPPAANVKVDYRKDVQPLLAQKCYSCHGDVVQQSGLRLDRRQLALRGGDYGPVILPGRSAESKLIRRVVSGDGGLQMPPTGPLSDEEIGVLRAWIDQGAEFVLEVEGDAPVKPIDPKLAALISAVRTANLAEVKKIVAANPALVKGRDRAGSTPLHHAAGYGTPAIMEFLLAKGADVNAANKRHSTPLYWAIDDEAKVRLLIEHGADVNAKTVEGRTPVYQAAMLGDGTGVLQLLLDKGAAADPKTLTGMTPLMVAAGRANVEAMRLLIRNKADVNARNSAGSTVLMDAAQTGSVEAVQMLLDKGIDVNAKTKKNETALAYAATAGVEENVKLLLDRGAEVNVRDIRGYSPLLYAAGSDARPAGMVKMLLAKGADTKVEGDGETAAMLAAKRGNTAVASLLQAPEAAHKMSDILAVKDTKATERSIRDAVRPALALLEIQSRNFIRIGGCNSCHAQDLPSAAAGLARDHGLPAPKEIPQLPQYMHANTAERLMDLNTIGANGVGLSWELFDFGMNHVARDEYTDAVVHYLTSVQWPEGNWRANQSRRPPMSTGEYQATALAIYAIRHYGRPQDGARNGKAIARAAAWLERSRPTDTQDRAFRLLGLVWSDASAGAIADAQKELVSMQRADGGWSQFPTMESDAYASGEALFALNAGGVAATDAVYRKGVAYLLNTQAADGSWHVNTRSIWLQPYFESGFPYGHDQWISAAGTAWATMALSVTVNGPDNTRKLAAK